MGHETSRDDERSDDARIGRAAAAEPFKTRNTSVPEDPVSHAPDDARSVDPEQSQGPVRQSGHAEPRTEDEQES